MAYGKATSMGANKIKELRWFFPSDEISLGFYLEQQWGQQNKMSSQ
jgi:hypothetical protein